MLDAGYWKKWLKAQGARLRVYNKTFSLLKSEIPNPKSEIDTRWMLDAGCSMLATRYWMLV
jgi:hypothetical protein